MPGGEWEVPADEDWPICLNATTTTAAPTTTSPRRGLTRKCNFPMNPHVRLLDGWSVCYNFGPLV